MVGIGAGGSESESVGLELAEEARLGSLVRVQMVPGSGVVEPALVTVKEMTVKLVLADEVILTGELV